MSSSKKEQPLLDVKNLTLHFLTESGRVEALDNVNFDVGYDEAIGIVGESGCGKTQTAHTVMRILAKNAQVVEGEIYFKGHDLLDLSENQMRKVRGKHIALIFQDPLTSLNPVYTIESQMVEVIQLHQKCSEDEALDIAIEMMAKVGIPDPETRISDYPFQFSGGMRQRILIARALALEPTLLIADEPTTALDVTIQAQVLQIIRDLREQYGLSLMLITHNLGVVAELTDRVHIFYGGNVVESGETKNIFRSPRHPYTQALLRSIPSLTESKKKLDVIKGNVPQLINPPTGCRFHPRCRYAQPKCIDEKPPMEKVDLEDHTAACHYWEDILEGTMDERSIDDMIDEKKEPAAKI